MTYLTTCLEGTVPWKKLLQRSFCWFSHHHITANFFFSETAEYPNMKCIWHFEDPVSSFSLYISSVAFHTDMLVLHKKNSFCMETTLNFFSYYLNFILYYTSSQLLSAFDRTMSLKHESITTTLKACLLLLYPINIYSVSLKYL